jgi:hypothetical protein
MSTSENASPKKKLKKWQIFVIVILGLMVIGQFSGGNSSPSTQSVEEQRQQASDDLTDKYTVEPAWYPADYNEYSSDLAWRWGTSKETKCSYGSGSCWSVMVISKSGCSSSLYGEIKIFDSSDIQIDYTNDSTSTVSPMQKVKLTFDTFNEQADSAQIGELKCY